MRAFIVATLGSVLLAPLPQLPPRDQPARQGLQSAATAAISGRVYAAATGTPLQGALVFLASASSSEIAPGSLPRDAGARTGALTDALGRFRITGVAPGVYRLIANPAAYAGRYLAAGHGALRGNDAGKRLTLIAGEEINNADIALPTIKEKAKIQKSTSCLAQEGVKNPE